MNRIRHFSRFKSIKIIFETYDLQAFLFSNVVNLLNDVNFNLSYAQNSRQSRRLYWRDQYINFISKIQNACTQLVYYMERNHAQLQCQSEWKSTLHRNRVIYDCYNGHHFLINILQHKWFFVNENGRPKPETLIMQWINMSYITVVTVDKAIGIWTSFCPFSEMNYIIIYWDWQFR